MHAGLGTELGEGPVVVEPGHGAELVAVKARGVGRGDKGIGIGRVAHHQDFDIGTGVVVDGLALHREDGGVGGEQVLALHARTPGTGAHQEGEVGAVKGFLGLVGGDDVVQQGEGAIPQLHDDAFEGAHGGGDFEQV